VYTSDPVLPNLLKRLLPKKFVTEAQLYVLEIDSVCSTLAEVEPDLVRFGDDVITSECLGHQLAKPSKLIAQSSATWALEPRSTHLNSFNSTNGDVVLTNSIQAKAGGI
jgi:hypothetical protein